MRALLLGTGAADGWPNPWCDCASCTWARADSGRVRAHTAVLLDGGLLIDCGPDVPRQAARAGAGLGGLQAILLTHGHWDHADPAAVLTRAWSGRDEPLQVLGPPTALARLAEWRGPGPGDRHVEDAPSPTGSTDGLTLVPLRAADTVEVAGYRVHALAAAHAGHSGPWAAPDEVAAQALIYDLTAPDGTRLLYATDTGPLPASTWDAVAGRSYDLVLLDETFGRVTDHGTGHLDLTTFPMVLAELRRRGAVTAATDVVAVHLGHHNPPGPALDRLLASWGARTVPDLTTLTTPTTPTAEPRHGAVSPPGPGACHVRPARELVLGGARSGKSRYAEERLAAEVDVRYVATSTVHEGDPEWAERVAVHRARRPTSWRTVETTDLASVLRSAPAGSAVLVDCLTLWLTEILDAVDGWDGTRGSEVVEARIDELVAAVRATRARLVLVSNEVGSGVVPPYRSGRIFQDLLGGLNVRVAQACDAVTLVVAGRPLPLP